MICGLQIGLFVMGIVMLITGRMKLSANKVVEGWPARLLGLLALVPLPLCLLIGLVFGIRAGLQGQVDVSSQEKIILGVTEAGITLGDLALLFIIGFAVAVPPLSQRKVTDYDEDEEEEEEDDRPRRRSRATYDDEDDADDEPRRRFRR